MINSDLVMKQKKTKHVKSRRFSVIYKRNPIINTMQVQCTNKMEQITQMYLKLESQAK